MWSAFSTPRRCLIKDQHRGISGSFQMTATLDEVEANSCKPASPANLLSQVISLTGSGTVFP